MTAPAAIHPTFSNPDDALHEAIAAFDFDRVAELLHGKPLSVIEDRLRLMQNELVRRADAQERTRDSKRAYLRHLEGLAEQSERRFKKFRTAEDRADQEAWRRGHAREMKIAHANADSAERLFSVTKTHLGNLQAKRAALQMFARERAALRTGYTYRGQKSEQPPYVLDLKKEMES